MSKRTRIAVLGTALLVGVILSTFVVDGNRQTAQASTVDGGKIYRLLDEILPKAGLLRAGRPAPFTVTQRWRLADIACTVNELHDNVYEYEPVVNDLLLAADLPNPYRFQSPVLTLSQRIHRFKEDAGLAYTLGSETFCEYADWRVDRPASGATR